MLRTISIRNFAIIEKLDLEFGAGFNVLTGETGAGKSIIMDALNLILGGRSGAEMVRGGAERASIDAVFDIGGSPELVKIVADLGFETEDDMLFLSRDVNASGKSSARVAGRPATVAQLREIGDWLVDLHGQHEHQYLLASSRHMDILDEWGGKAIAGLREEVSAAFGRVQALRREKSALETDARERAHLLDLYVFQSKEIHDAKLLPGEEAELMQEQKRGANAQKLAEAAGSAAAYLSGGDETGGALAALASALRVLEDAAALDDGLQSALEAVRSASYELSETERDLVRYQDTVELDPERLEEIETRIDTIRALKRKYGDSIEEILAYGAEVAGKVEALSHSEERGAQLDSEIQKALKRLEELSAKLSKLRHEAAKKFQTLTLTELRDLAMEKVRFEVQIEKCEPGAKGSDRVEFLIATNPGEPLRPLAKVASGGEISRVMLAMKSALASQESLPTMVFDEIDVGVGGRTASVIAEKMAHLSQSAQILCITHLAQLASRGDRHFYIEKRVTGSRTTVSVTPLSPEQRIAEVARMIGGAEVTEIVLQHAREMLRVA